MLSEKEKLKLITQIEQKLGIQFQNEMTSENVCFAHQNEELQDDFKVFFTISDFRFFIQSFSGKKVIIPMDTASFWKLVEKGKNFSENSSESFGN